MEHIINITQTIEQVDDRDWQVKMEIESEGGSTFTEFNYTDTNGIFPLYNSLINTIRQFKDVHINLTTSNQVFVKEVNGSAGKNSRLLQILNETKQEKGVTIDAYTK